MRRKSLVSLTDNAENKLLSLHHALETAVFAFHLFLKQFQQNVILSSFCIPKVIKSATKKNENRLTNKNLTPKNDLDLVLCMYKGGNLNVFQ